MEQNTASSHTCEGDVLSKDLGVDVDGQLGRGVERLNGVRNIAATAGHEVLLAVVVGRRWMTRRIW